MLCILTSPPLPPPPRYPFLKSTLATSAFLEFLKKSFFQMFYERLLTVWDKISPVLIERCSRNDEMVAFWGPGDGEHRRDAETIYFP